MVASGKHTLYEIGKFLRHTTVIETSEAVKNDYNLNHSRYGSPEEREEVLPLEDAVVQLREAEEERTEADRKLKEILQGLGLEV